MAHEPTQHAWDIYDGLMRMIAGRRYGAMRVDTDVWGLLCKASDADKEAFERLITAYRERREGYLTVDDLASRWKISPRLVRRLAESGALTGGKRGGRWEFRPAAVERYEAAHTVCGGVRVQLPSAAPIALAAPELLDQACRALEDTDWQTEDLEAQFTISQNQAYKLILAWYSAGVVRRVRRGWYRFTHAQPQIDAAK